MAEQMEGLAPEEERKLFIGGLPQEANDADLKEYFASFGEIETLSLKTDPISGRSRGFAFIIYKEPSAVQQATENENHVIKGKKVTCKKAEGRAGKIFVGKLPEEGVSKEDLESHFAQYGTVSDVQQPLDKQTEKPRNYAFVTFEKEEVAKKLIKDGAVTVNGHELDIRRVQQKNQGGRGGYGGGYGGGMYGDPYAMYGGYGYGAYGGYGMYPSYGYGGGDAAGGKMSRGGGRGRGGRGRSRPY
eukprot:TRINITY_DN1681_c0_g2_i1.p1 TRINITY_DN1681_c0_g2~~TRINITY_DN1681_c0_g2_i1.p1  ORF type:complete len:244 (-),score=112.92 TRINITY_DN1681_c0_g2_i1:200-931(-)